MRVIAGTHRSRLLAAPEGLTTRPTPDRLRQSLFDILAPVIEGATFLDAYAGTGAVGIEALSRGASHATFLEKDRAALAALSHNIRALKLEPQSTVIARPAAQQLARLSADIVFVDPPYDLPREYESAIHAIAGNAPPLLAIQHSTRHALAETIGPLTRYRTLEQGDNAISFYRARGEPDPG